MVRLDKESIYRRLLVLQCQRGEPAAWQELVTRWDRRLSYYIRRLVDNEQDAWDVLQETWLAAFEGMHRLRDAHSLSPWLYQIARNHCMNLHRSRGANISRPSCEFAPEPADRADDTASLDNVEQVHSALDQLLLWQREVLTLFFLGDLKIEEIAQVLNVPPGTVKSRLYYAKQALRAILEKENAK